MNLLPLSNFISSRITTYVILVCVCFLSFSQCKQNQDLKQQLKQNKSRISIATKIVKEYIDGNGSQHTVVQTSALTKQQATNFLKNDTYVNDTLVKALNIANDKISELTRINGILTGTSKGKPDEPNNVLSTVRGSDRWMTWNYNPTDTTLNWAYDLDLSIVGYNKRRKILGLGIGDKVNYQDYFSADPRIKIQGVDRLTIEQTKPTFAFRLNATSRYNFATGQVRIGPSLEFDYKRFTVGGSYVYEPTANRWEIVVEPKIRLIGF